MNNIILERIFQTIQVIRQSKDVSSALELLSETKVMGVRCIQRHNHDAITKTQQLNQIKCWLIKCSLAKPFYYRFPRQIRKSSLFSYKNSCFDGWNFRNPSFSVRFEVILISTSIAWFYDIVSGLLQKKMSWHEYIMFEELQEDLRRFLF